MLRPTFLTRNWPTSQACWPLNSIPDRPDPQLSLQHPPSLKNGYSSYANCCKVPNSGTLISPRDFFSASIVTHRVLGSCFPDRLRPFGCVRAFTDDASKRSLKPIRRPLFLRTLTMIQRR